MIKLSTENDRILAAKLQEAGQDHLFSFWDELDSAEQKELLAQLQALDLPTLLPRIARYRKKGRKTAKARVYEPCSDSSRLEVDSPARPTEQVELERKAGKKLLRDGKVAVVISGTESVLDPSGEPVPLGCTPIGPVSEKSLFQLQAEKLVALGKKYRSSPPILLMTSSVNHDQTVEHFQRSDNFGLSLQDLKFHSRPALPVLSRRGLMLLRRKHQLALASPGHGASLDLLLEDDIFKRLKNRGIEHVLFFVVDNPLVRVADTRFLGRHLEGEYEVSCKVVTKLDPDEAIATFCHCNGHPTLVEPEDLSEVEQNLRRDDGSLAFDQGDTETHLFSLAFLGQLKERGYRLPLHVSECVTPYVDRRGRRISPRKPNGVAFQSHVGDALSEAEKVLLYPIDRTEEYSPLSRTGGEDPRSRVRSDLSRLYTRWLRQAGATTGRANGSTPRPPAVEISPLFALDADDVGKRVELPLEIESDLYVE